MNQEHLAQIAAHKVINQKTFSKLAPEVPAGVIPIDVCIRLFGAIKKGDPYQKRVSAKANPWKLLAKALSKLNQVTIDSIVSESISVSEDESKAVAEKAQQAIAKIVAETQTQMEGNITSTINLQLQ
jgi:hypothetical protein